MKHTEASPSNRSPEVDICLAICQYPISARLAEHEATAIVQGLAALPQPLALLERHALAPLAWSRLKDQLTGDLAHGLRLLAWRHQHSNTTRFTWLVTILQQLEQAHCQPVLLKGAALLAQGIYPHIAWRPMRDIDILIHPGRWREAVSVLNKAGFTFDAPTRIARYPYLHQLPAASYSDGTGVILSLELHQGLLAFDGVPLEETRHLLTRTTIVQYNEIACRILDLEPFLMHLWRNQMGHSYQPRFISYLDGLLLALTVPETHWQGYERNSVEMVNYIRMLFRAFQYHHPPLEDMGPSVSGFGRGLPTFQEAWYGSWAVKRALLRPPDWWLHAFYGVAETRPIFHLLWWRHPLNLLRRILRKAQAWLGSFSKKGRRAMMRYDG